MVAQIYKKYAKRVVKIERFDAFEIVDFKIFQEFLTRNLYFSTEKIGLFICRDLKVNHHVQSVLKNIILEDKYLTNQKTRHMNANVKYQ